MKLEQRPSGLVIPEQPKEPEPVRGPLELLLDSDRKRAYDALQELYNLTTSNAIKMPGYDRKPTQQEAVKFLATLLLGDVEFWEYT